MWGQRVKVTGERCRRASKAWEKGGLRAVKRNHSGCGQAGLWGNRMQPNSCGAGQLLRIVAEPRCSLPA